MKKFFYSLAIALVALMVSIPAKAVRIQVINYQELFGAIGQGFYDGYMLTEDDVISIEEDITWTHHDGTYLFVSANVTRNLDLNGHTLRFSTNDEQYFYAITLKNNSVLNIYDSKGGGKFICNALIDFARIDNDYNKYMQVNRCLYGVSNCVVNMSEGNNNVLNIYGGELQAFIKDAPAAQTSVVYNCYHTLFENDIQTQAKFTASAINIYGGKLSSICNEYGIPYINGSKYDRKTFSNEKVTINLYGGELGNASADFPGLNYYKGFKGELKEGTIYGISSSDHLNNFAKVTATDVYVDGTKSSVNALRSQDLTSKAVRFAYEPEISVSGVEVTKDNCTDIIPWEEFKASYDYATNTLRLKTLAPSNRNVLNGIRFANFDLRIVVDGHWRINGSIVGINGDLLITSNHFALTEEDGDALVMQPGNETSIKLDGHQLVLSNRVRLICYNSEMNTTPQSAVKCHDMWVNNSWFDAWGKKPVVYCAYGSVVNAHIKVGSFKNNDVISIEPNLQSYIVSVIASEGGEVNPDNTGISAVTYNGNTTNYTYNEGVSIQMTATPKSGYHFLRWSNGVTENPYTFVVTQDTVLYALFEADVVINYYDINVVSSDETMGTVSGGGTHLEQGQTVTITATPNEGYQFLYWTTADGQVQGAISQWTVTEDETLIAHFRVAPPADAYMLWVCGTQVTGSNSADILGDGVWCYDHATRTLTVMKDATYNITNDGFIEDWAGSGTDEPLIVNVGNHKVEAICTTTDNVIRNAIVGTKGMTFTGTTYHGVTLTAQNMYAANFSNKPLTVTWHMDLTLNLKNTTDWGKDNFKTAVLLAGVTPSLIVDGANFYINSGVGESAGQGYKATNKTDQAANLSLNNAVVDDGSISAKYLYISDNSPKYEINYITPSLESLCLTSVFGLSFFEGTHFNLYAYPATGYKFVSWSDGNTDNPRIFIMPAHNVYLDPIVEVDDSQTPKGAIINASATEGQGSIADFTSGWYAEGTELTITAVAAEGYTFVQWSDGEVANPYFITVEDKKNINITAMFEPTATAVNNVESQKSNVKVQKILRNGHLLILRDGQLFNAQGARVK